MKAAFAAIDADGDEAISGDEIQALVDAAMEGMEGDHGEMPPPPDGEMPPPPPDGEMMGPPPFPHIVIPAPGDFMPPPPEDGHEAFMHAAFEAIDADGDGKLSKDEVKAAFDSAMHHHGGPCDGDPCGAMHDDMGGMDPEWEMAECNGIEGNHVIRGTGGQRRQQCRGHQLA